MMHGGYCPRVKSLLRSASACAHRWTVRELGALYYAYKIINETAVHILTFSSACAALKAPAAGVRSGARASNVAQSRMRQPRAALISSPHCHGVSHCENAPF